MWWSDLLPSFPGILALNQHRNTISSMVLVNYLSCKLLVVMIPGFMGTNSFPCHAPQRKVYCQR